jgi:SAM-dependent methyltransferase
MKRLEIPPEYNRNAPDVVARGVEETGARLINMTMAKLGLSTLADKDILDGGCGTRFTLTLINREIPIRSYTGIDVAPHLIHYLNEHVDDPRFRFFHWPVHNAMYNAGVDATVRNTPLPVADDFDIIWLYSVFTHLAPDDTDALLDKLRSVIRPDAILFFSAFLDETIDGFLDSIPGEPLHRAYYGVNYMQSLVEKNGWSIAAMFPPQALIPHHFICHPA